MSPDTADIDCAQQLCNNKLIEWTVSEKRASSAGSGAEGVVAVTSDVELLQGGYG